MMAGWRGGVGILLLCLVCYANSFEGSFHYDDFHSLVENPGVRSLRNIPGFFADPGFFSGDEGKRMYRPLLLMTYAFNYAIGGYGVWGYHLFNLGLHFLCSLLTWRLGRRLIGEKEGVLAGLVFAVHPLAAEPVNYISSRSESLAAVFFLGTFLLHLKGEQRKEFRSLGVLVYGLGLLVKSVVITAPALLWLHDRWISGKRMGWKLYACYGAVGAGYLLLIRQNGFLTRSLDQPVRGFGAQLWTQAKAPVYYFKLLFFPHGLNVEHQFFESLGSGEGAVLGGIGLICSLVVVAWMGKGNRLLGFCLVWGGVVLLPSTLMPLNMLVNERRVYLAVAGFAWAVGFLSRHVPRRMAYAVLPFFGLLTFERNAVWRDELALWGDAVEKAPAMYRAQVNSGKALQLAGREERAALAYRRAIELEPNNGDAYNNMATILHERAIGQEKGKSRQQLLGEAIDWYRMALERNPGYEKIYQNLGDAYTQRGDLEGAIGVYEAALEKAPSSGALWSNYGQTLLLVRRGEEAEKALLQAIELMDERPEPFNNLGNLYSGRKDFPQAVEMYRAALAREPERAGDILVNLGGTYREMGDSAAAREALNKALALEPGLAEAHYQLGRVAGEVGEVEDAGDHFRRALDLDSRHNRARAVWGELLKGGGKWQEGAALFEAALALDSTYSRAWYGLGECLESLGDSEGAMRAYRQFLKNWPEKDRRYRQVVERMSRMEEK